MIGKILSNRYEIIELIGQGGMAKVYKAKDTFLNRFVAIKVLKPEFVGNEQFIKKFKRESQAAASLSHPNIVNIYDVGVVEEINYIVMEFVKGSTLKEHIKLKGPMKWKEVILISTQIASALDHAHKNHIIHRDIKPHNILLTEEKLPKVADFGIARAITSSTITISEETMGSVHYISPEQARGGFVDEKSDLYSLGVLMYELITGKLLFEGDNSISVAIKHIQNEIVPPKQIDSSIPDGLNDIIVKLLNKSPSDRYNSAIELIKDLNSVKHIPNNRIFNKEHIEDSPTQVTPIIKNIENKEKKHNAQKTDNQKQSIKISTIIIVILLSIIFGIMIYFLGSYLLVQEVEVPNIVGLTLNESIRVLEKSELKIQIEKREYNTEIDKDRIISQNPEQGTKVKENQSVKVIISDGARYVKVPSVIGKFDVEGKNDLENLGFIIKEINRAFNEEYENGIIFDQNPSAGIEAKEASEIILFVSKGKDTATVPNLIGESEESAKDIILSTGLLVGKIEYVISDKYDKGIVVEQDPLRNSEVAKETLVNLKVSRGKRTSKTVNINLNDLTKFEEVKLVDVKVILFDQESKSVVVYEQQHYSNDNITVTMVGVGIQYYQVVIDGKEYVPVVITF